MIATRTKTAVFDKKIANRNFQFTVLLSHV
jgi:hypothetical protein